MNKTYKIDKSELYDDSGEYYNEFGLTPGHLWARIFPRLPNFSAPI